MLSGELAVSTALATARQLTRQAHDLASAVLSRAMPNCCATAHRCEARPLKVGQMLSLQSDDIIPAEFRNALSMLRSQGYAMPDTQLKRVLGREYGKGWERKFAVFDPEPVAAASIGQIHRARKHGGRELALKIQYPGVARSVDSDVDNLATLLRRLDFLP
jgi:predicted unusual protein kinase regulating ubiquinone biosynthesis (AarF/ABC1/UbiB family)